MCLFNKKSFFIKNLTDCTKFAKYCMPSSGAISFKIQLITKYTRAPFSKMIVTRRLVWNFQLLWSSSFMYFVTPCRNNAHLIKLKSQFMKVINIKLKFMGSQGCPNPSYKIEWSSHWSRSPRFYILRRCRHNGLNYFLLATLDMKMLSPAIYFIWPRVSDLPFALRNSCLRNGY